MENSSEIRDRMFNQVKEYIETYLYSIQTIRTLEVKAGKSGINRKFVENLRHGHDHFCQAMLSLVGTPPKLSGNQDNFSSRTWNEKSFSGYLSVACW